MDKKPNKNTRTKHLSSWSVQIIVAIALIFTAQLFHGNEDQNVENEKANHHHHHHNHHHNQHHQEHKQYKGLEIVPKDGKTFGADVYGFDPQSILFDEFIGDTIQRALEKHLVLVFHDVSEKLSPELHLEFAKLLGPVDISLSGAPSYLKSGKFNSPDQVRKAAKLGVSMDQLGKSMLEANPSDGSFPPEITRIVKQPKDVVAFGEGMHSDLTYRQNPPSAALLVSRDLPPVGQGNTHFLDMRYAFSELEESVKDYLRSMKANHTDGGENWSLHPVVRTDGKQDSLFVNKAFTRHFVLSKEQQQQQQRQASAPVSLESLFSYVDKMPKTHPHAFLNISWSEGQMVMWDNRYTQHAANADYTTRREMHRVVVTGPKPQ